MLDHIVTGSGDKVFWLAYLLGSVLAYSVMRTGLRRRVARLKREYESKSTWRDVSGSTIRDHAPTYNWNEVSICFFCALASWITFSVTSMWLIGVWLSKQEPAKWM